MKNDKIIFNIKIFYKYQYDYSILWEWKKKTRRNHKTNVILKEKATFNEQECMWKTYPKSLW